MDDGDADVIQRFESASELWLPIIAMGEQFAGFALGTRRAQNENQLQDFLQKPSVGVLLPDEETARFYGGTFQVLRLQGTPIPTNDIWIAALALQHDLTLDTGDAHFQHVPRLKLVTVSP